MPDEPVPANVNTESTEGRQPPVAWQPLTPRGVSAFAFAGFGRLLAVECIIALLAAVAAVWFLSSVWFPAVREAIRNLPEQGVIVGGELKWPRHSFEVLYERRPFLGFLVDLDNRSRGNPGTDLSVQFRKHDLLIVSLFGRRVIPYDNTYQIEFSRREVEPRWQAWKPIFLAGAAVLVPVSLLLIWAFLATIYFVPAWLIAFFANRKQTWAGSWKLASAALMPGALLFIVAIVLYGLSVLDFFHLLLVLALHFVVGWIYVAASSLQLPPIPAAPPKGNPFTSAPDESPESPGPGKNPLH